MYVSALTINYRDSYEKHLLFKLSTINFGISVKTQLSVLLKEKSDCCVNPVTF